MSIEETRQQAQAEGLTLLVADNKTGYFGVCLNKPGQAKPYQADLSRGGKMVYLGSFATAEEAALRVARSPEGQAVAAERAAAVAPLTSEEARQQAQAEGLPLLVAESTTGYFGVAHHGSRSKPYEARVRRGGTLVSLGMFVTAQEAALHVARSPEGQAAAQRPAAPTPLTSEEARQQAQAEKLTLLVAENKTGYYGVNLEKRNPYKPYQASMSRGGKNFYLGGFATAEEAALCVARSPEGQTVAAERAAAAVPLTSEEARQQAQAEGLTLLVAGTKTGYYAVHLQTQPGRPKPYQAKVTRGGKLVNLGSFATAEEAALRVARSPEGQAAAARRQAAAARRQAAAARRQARQQARQQARAGELTQLVALLVKEEEGEEECSGVRPKRPRAK